MKSVTIHKAAFGSSIGTFAALAGMFVSFIALFASVAIGGAMMTVTAVMASPARLRGRIFVICSTILIVVFSLMKRPEADEYYYLLYIDSLRGLVGNELGAGTFSIRDSEPIFILFSKICAQVDYGKILFIVGMIATVFGIAGSQILRFCRGLNVAPIPILVFSFALSINVFGAAQLMRQYAATAIATIAIVYLIKGRFGWALMILGVSLLVHNASGLLMLPFLAGITFRRFPKLTFAAAVGFALVGYFYLAGQTGSFADATDNERWLQTFAKDDGSVPIWLIGADIGLFLSLIYGWLPYRWKEPSIDYFIGFVIMLAALLIAVSSQNLLFLRTYVVVEFFRPFVLAVVLRRMRLGRDLLAGQFLIAVSLAYFIYRLSVTPFDYGGSPEQIAAIGLNGFLERLGSFNLQ